MAKCKTKGCKRQATRNSEYCKKCLDAKILADMRAAEQRRTLLKQWEPLIDAGLKALAKRLFR